VFVCERETDKVCVFVCKREREREREQLLATSFEEKSDS